MTDCDSCGQWEKGKWEDANLAVRLAPGAVVHELWSDRHPDSGNYGGSKRRVRFTLSRRPP